MYCRHGILKNLVFFAGGGGWLGRGSGGWGWGRMRASVQRASNTDRAAARTTHARFDAIICDIDGCLSPETSDPLDLDGLRQIAEHNRLAQLQGDRPVLTLCSGRPQPFAEAMCRLLANMSLPLVAENGVWLYTPASNVYSMDPAIEPTHRASVREAAAWLDERFGPEGVSQQPGKSASISLYHPEPTYLQSICPTIQQACAHRGWPLRISMTWNYINCDLVQISKSTGVRRLLEQSGLTAARCLGIGDTMGDLGIRENVGHFACPSNAAPALMAHADFIAQRPEVHGVLEILQALCSPGEASILRPGVH